MTTDISSYNTPIVAPPNALQLMGEYADVGNALIQQNIARQQLQQQQIVTQQAQGQQRIAQIVGQHTGPDGRVDWLGVKSAAAKDPLAAMNYSHVEAIADPQLAATHLGVTPTGAPRNVTLGEAQRELVGAEGSGPSQLQGQQPPAQVQPSQPQGQQPPAQVAPPPAHSGPEQPPTAAIPGSMPGGVAGGLPAGYAEMQAPNEAHLNEVRAARDVVPQQKAVLSEIYDLSKKGTPSGTAWATVAQDWAKSGFAPAGITVKAENIQQMSKYMEQAALAAGMPASDARLQAVENANTHPDQLPGAIQALVPFLKATSEGNRIRANYYDSQVGNGLDYNKIVNSQHSWANNYDPRGVLLTELPNKDEKIKYLKGLTSAEREKAYKSAKFIKPYLNAE